MESQQLGIPSHSTDHSRQLGIPSHLAAQCSDKILMHIHRPCNFEQTLDYGYEDLSSRKYTDVTLIAEDGTEFQIHGFLLSAASPYLSHLLSNTFSPNLEHTIVLPDVQEDSVRVLCKLLYGATVVLSSDQIGHLNRLVDLLSITLSLALTDQEQEHFQTQSNEHHTEKKSTEKALLSKNDEESNESDVTNLPVDACDSVEDYQVAQYIEKSSQSHIDDKEDVANCSVAEHEETVKTSDTAVNTGDTAVNISDTAAVPALADLPVCCWHCNEDFTTFPALSDHLALVHAGEKAKSEHRRHHRCNRCGDVVGSMWKLRQHLLTHQKVGRHSGKPGDHVYAGRSGRSGRTLARGQSGDHGYATAKVVAWPTIHQKEEEATQCAANDTATPIVVASATPPVSSVCSEHSYGTKRDSSPEGEEREEARERSDHPYSQGNIKKEAGVENGLIDDGVEKFPIPDTEPVRPDHQYSMSKISRKRTGKQKDPKIGAHLPRKLAKIRSAKDKPQVKLPPLPVKKKEAVAGTSVAFSCDKCSKTFPASYRLKRHVREVHNKEKLHKCDSCDKDFFKSTSLLRHQIAMHSNLRPYTCNKCQLGFKDPTGLKYHMQNDVCRNGKRGAKRK